MTALEIAAGLVKQFEGCRLQAYSDLGGVLTIGWGATGKEIHEGSAWSQEAADARLMSDLTNAQAAVHRHVKVPLTPCQEAALISFTYNLGEGNFGHSTLLALLNQGDIFAAAENFPRWSNAGGQKVKGLLRRRFSEAALFLT